MKRRLDRIEGTQTIKEAVENARLASLAKLVRKKMNRVAPLDYQAAIEKLSDEELTALVWAHEQDAHIAWSRIPGKTLRAIAESPADDTTSLHEIDQATEALRGQYPTIKETPSQFRRRHALFHG